MAQLVARDVWDVDAAGSNPVTPTKNQPKTSLLDLFSANFYIFSTKLAISVDHMFACFFGFYWIISYLFLDPFENPFSLLSATQILRADRLISVSSFAFTSP